MNAALTESARENRSRPSGWNGEMVRAAFQKAAESRQWTAGYRSMDVDRIACDAVRLSAPLPAGLRGTLFRNGPARHERGGERYGHRWDGDGMLQQFHFTDRGVSHVGQFIHTEKYNAETASARFLLSAFGTHIPGSDTAPDPIDAANVANISVLHFAGELLALWEPGSAYRIDPATLSTLGVKVWHPSLAGRPFSAHPRVEADGTLWNFGADPLNGELTIYCVARTGELIRSHVASLSQLPPIHDFATTGNHLVFLLSPLVLSKERLDGGASFAEACQWLPRQGMRALTIDKRDWSERFYDLPPGCLFHVANAWEDGNGTIRMHYMRADNPMSMIAGWSVMRGEYRHQEGARLTEVILDPARGKVTQTTVGELESEFPSIEASEVGREYTRILCLERTSGRAVGSPGYDQVAIVDVDSGRRQQFTYGDDWLVEEHIYADDPGSTRSRWILGMALDLLAKQSVINVFDANHLGDGPVAQARLDRSLPLGLHGNFRSSRADL